MYLGDGAKEPMLDDYLVWTMHPSKMAKKGIVLAVSWQGRYNLYI